MFFSCSRPHSRSIFGRIIEDVRWRQVGLSAITLSSVMNRQMSNIGQSWSIIESSGCLLQPKNISVNFPNIRVADFFCLWSGKMCKAKVVITKFHRVLLLIFFVYARGRNTSIWFRIEKKEQ